MKPPVYSLIKSVHLECCPCIVVTAQSVWRGNNDLTVGNAPGALHNNNIDT